jgi:hypothetical protein
MGKRLLVPLEEVEQLIDYLRCPLPLAKRWVAGIGLFGDQPLVSIALWGITPKRPQHTKGVLLRSQSNGLRFAIEVDEAFSFLDVDAPRSATPNERPWLKSTSTSEGALLEVLDARALLRELGAESHA